MFNPCAQDNLVITPSYILVIVYWLTVNVDMTFYDIFRWKQKKIPAQSRWLALAIKSIMKLQKTIILELQLDEHLSWNEHINDF